MNNTTLSIFVHWIRLMGLLALQKKHSNKIVIAEPMVCVQVWRPTNNWAKPLYTAVASQELEHLAHHRHGTTTCQNTIQTVRHEALIAVPTNRFIFWDITMV